MKKALSKALCVISIAALLFGMSACANNGEAKTDTNQPVSEKKSETDNNGAKDKVTLKLWHMWVSDSDGNKKPFQNVLKHVEEQFKDVELVVEGIDNESYKTKLKNSVSTNQLPDIFFTWSAGFSKPFVESGKVLALDEYIGDLKGKLLPGITDSMTYDGKVYGLPYQMQVAPLYCNKELFEQNGVKIPETYEELLTAVNTFSKKGITPMVNGAKELWPAMFYYDILALRTAGAQQCINALNKKSSFDSPEFIDAAAKLVELSKAGAFGENPLKLSYDSGNTQFAEGKAAMLFNGNWVAGVVESETSQVKGKIIATKFPLISGGKGIATEYLGGAGDGFMVSSNTPNKDLAVKVVKFIAEDMAREAYLANAGMPGWNVQVDDSNISPMVKQMVNMTKDSTAWVLWWDVFLESADADIHKNLVVELIAGQISPEDFAKEMQKLNDK
ncbi:MAG: Multiple sugar-binding protein precursor [Firmicutes bacterium ADurb.Bin419]|nr:MAG: Multiple sugar-binding protein precursor [Firmicutes bacterium ADurb.Bin419]